MRRTFAAALVIAGTLPTASVSGHDEPLAPEEIKGLRAAIAVAKEGEGGATFSPETVRRMDEALRDVPTAHFDHLNETAGYKDLPAAAQAGLERGTRAVSVLRSCRKDLANPLGVSCLLSSNDPVDVGLAMHELTKEPYGEGFRKVVVNFAADARPEVRLGAGILAKFGTLLGAPNDGFRAVAVNLLSDKDPQVAAKFGGSHCVDFGDASLVDKLVASFSDTRTFSGFPGSVFATGFETVSESSMASFARVVGGVRANGTFTPSALSKFPETRDTRAYAEWWKKNRQAWNASAPPTGAEVVFDGVVDLVPGELVALKGATREVSLKLREFKVLPHSWLPEVSLKVEIHDRPLYGGLAFLVGTPSQPFGWISTAQNDSYTIRILAAPTTGETVRVRVWLSFKP